MGTLFQNVKRHTNKSIMLENVGRTKLNWFLQCRASCDPTICILNFEISVRKIKFQATESNMKHEVLFHVNESDGSTGKLRSVCLICMDGVVWVLAQG